MSAWDVMTVLTILVLGPGAVVVFVACVRDVRRLLRTELRGRAPPAQWEKPYRVSACSRISRMVCGWLRPEARAPLMNSAPECR